jgi:hypothetical protein
LIAFSAITKSYTFTHHGSKLWNVLTLNTVIIAIQM